MFDGIISIASRDSGIVGLYLFGSHARGNATAFSDVDIAVIHKDADINRAALNEAADLYDADISYTYVQSNIFENDNHPLHVSSSIKKEGVLLWQR
jgi:predicted nucleotidyltransferase